MQAYKETVSLCPVCAQDSPAFYETRRDGVWLYIICSRHGESNEKVENDPEFFKLGYEHDYQKLPDHLAVPITYRCNIRCRHCYTCSNSKLPLPPDRSVAELKTIFRDYDQNITLIGGEPTIRNDLEQLVTLTKQAHRGRKVCLATNGQKTADLDYLKALRESGLDFLFFSFNGNAYDGPAVHANKIKSLRNCLGLGMPVWLQQTINNTDQLQIMRRILTDFRKIIFKTTIRSVSPIGPGRPASPLFISDILKALGKESAYERGNSPFNRFIEFAGKRVKLCNWTNDMKRLDPIDFSYITADDNLTTFHRGMKVDEVLIKQGRVPSSA